MSATLYALVVLQGTGLSFSPGYTSAAECLQLYKGPYVSCFAYDPSLSTWTAFFKLPEGGFRTVGKISSEDECKRYVGAFKDGIPTACRQLAMPNSCNVACVAPVQPPAIPPKPPEVSPDPASLRDEVTPPGLAGINTNIQVGGKQYTKVTGLTWVDSTKPDSFADVSVGPNDLQSKDQPLKVQTAEAPKKRVVVAQGPHYYDRAPQPLQAFIDTVMLPFDFLSYPGRRDW